MEIYHNKRLSVELKEVTLPDGKSREGVIVHPGDAVVVLPKCGDSCWYLIRQYRFAIGSYILEAPAGTMEPGETPLETASRELIEETGFLAGKLIEKGFIYTTPGFTDEKIYLFEARDLSPSDVSLKDEDEFIELIKVTGHELGYMCKDGRISDAKTISVVYRCLGDGACQ
jgi:ADP-ribose diphosphatase